MTPDERLHDNGYGTREKTTAQANGSTKTDIFSIFKHNKVEPSRVRYRIPHRLKKDDWEGLYKIAKTLALDDSNLNACLEFERTKAGNDLGYLHVIEVFERVEL